ncbi:MAG: caspase family protein, partial [Alphaproteobacteria bacterium]|nr:caspase family protein [Alphaproteobacteria bacterium]
IKKLSSEKIVGSLKGSDNETVVEVGAVLEQTAKGKKTEQSDLAKMLTNKGFDNKSKLSYLALHQHVVKKARTKLFSGALEVLKQNPDAANVFDKIPTGKDTKPPKVSQVKDVVAPNGKVVSVAGKIDDDSKFVSATINGKWVYVKKDGTFNIDASLAEGKSTVILETVDESGNKTKKTINIGDRLAKADVDARPRGKKVALLLGVNKYKSSDVPELDTPVTDVTEVGKVLADLFGYEIKVLENPTKENIVDALRDMSENMSTDDKAVIYYAGHGYSFEDSAEGYWLPSNADIDKVDNWVSTKDVSKFLHRMPAKNIKLIADSCYSGSFTQEQSITAADILTDKGELLNKRSVMAMSSGGDEPVWDGGADGHSLFAATLINTLKDVKVNDKGFDVFKQVKDKITQEAPQTPQYGAIKSAGYDKGGDYLFEKQ